MTSMLQLDIHCIEDEVGVHGIKCHHPLKYFDIHKNPMQTKPELQNPNVYKNRIYPSKQMFVTLPT